MSEKQGFSLQKVWLIILVASAIFTMAGSYMVSAERSKENKERIDYQEKKINDLTLIVVEMKAHFEHTNKSLDELKKMMRVLAKNN
jgi:uncharacterized coiled-coil protein SlyX